MKKYLIAFIVVCAAFLAIGWYKIEQMPAKNQQQFSVQAADSGSTPYNELDKAKVISVSNLNKKQGSRYSRITADLQAILLNGSQKGQVISLNQDEQLTDPRLQEIKMGDVIVVGKIETLGQPDSYVLVDRYRLPLLGWLAAGFLVLITVFAGFRGLYSIIGLAASVAILILFIAPNILAGKNAVLVTLVGACSIALVSMFLAHGFKQRTIIAVIATLLTLGMAYTAAYFSVIGTKLIGNGSEEAFYLQQGFLGNIDLRGLLLGGIIIGALGILNDITTAQSAAIEEIYYANKNLSFRQLYRKGISVGREHIASLINTLVLTYAGASLPLFLLVILTTGNHQLWAVLNSESLAEEIVRTLVGSSALVVAVPLTTALAAFYFTRVPTQPNTTRPVDDYWKK